jgi:sulfate adenylyltransferase large subunit
MATGASTADVAILLVDARHGVRVQSRRHAQIARLLGISTFVVAVNKMDLVDFRRDVFDAIRAEFSALLPGTTLHAIPISALHGDNVAGPSDRTPWFAGSTLLEFLEEVEVDRGAAGKPFRFPVQLVLRPSHEFRGYAGQMLSGTVRAGDPVTVWPSGRTTRIRRIVTWEGDLEMAFAPMSVTLVLDDEVDVSRGDVLASGEVEVGSRFESQIVWMDERPLDPARAYLLKQATRTVTAEVSRGLALNEIGPVIVTTATPLVFDRYADNRATGGFIVIDPATNFTAGAGMIVDPVRDRAETPAQPSAAQRLARLARAAPSDAAAAEAVRAALEEMLT